MIIVNPVLNRNQGKSRIDLSEKVLVWCLVVRLAEYNIQANATVWN
jgi:hypothetical protein